jgi:hypothetical protein
MSLYFNSSSNSFEEYFFLLTEFLSYHSSKLFSMKKKLLNAFIAITLLLMPNVNFGQSAPTLGTTSKFALFSAVGAFNNIGDATTVTGDVGTNVGAFNAFPPGILVGQKHVADPGSAQAAIDVDVAYSALFATTCGTVIPTTLGNGQILTPDVYCLGAASTLNGDLLLDGKGDPSSLFIFKIDGALSTSTFSNVILTNGASLCNVFWQINGQVELGDHSVFRGTIVANGAIILLEGASLFGRGLTREGAISLHNNVVTLETGAVAATITASGPTTICTGGNVILSGNIGGTWSTGATTASITVTTAGDYFVTNTSSCGGSVTSNHIIVTVNQQASCMITGNDYICCVGKTTELCVPFSASSKYLWSNGATTNCITVSAGGTYSVSVTTGGCTSTCQKTVTVAAAPVCTISGNNNICQGTTTQLCTPFGDGYTYLWSTGSTARCITVSTGGTYTLTITKNKKSSTCSKTITVTPAPSSAIQGSSIVYQGLSTKLCVPSSSTSTYLWSTGATTNCITISAAGTYSVVVTNAEGCTSTSKKTVTSAIAQTCLIEGNTSLCLGESTQLCTPSGTGYTYRWSTGSTSRCITVSAAGTYSLTVIKNGVPNTCTKTVTVSTTPCCPITGNNSICEGGSTSLCGPSGTGYKYLWSNGATSRCITVSAGGTYSLKVTKNGTSTTCSKTVAVTPLSCGISGNNTICIGGSTSLSAPAGTGYTYLWSNGATSRSITVSAAGTSTVTVTRGGCSATCSRTVSVSAPTSTIAGVDKICVGNSTSLCGPTGYGYTYLWNTGAKSRCLSVSAGGTYSLTVTAFGCSSTTTKIVTVNPEACSIAGNLFPTPGQTTTLCGPSGLSSYLWSNGATTQCIIVDCAGTYSLVTNSNGCLTYCNAYVSYGGENLTARATSYGNASVMNTMSGGEENVKVSAYPNPFYSTATIEFQNTKQTAHFVVELFSLSGNKVTTLFNAEVEQGESRKVEVNAGDLPSGIYVYRITSGRLIINKKLMLRSR